MFCAAIISFSFIKSSAAIFTKKLPEKFSLENLSFLCIVNCRFWFRLELISSKLLVSEARFASCSDIVSDNLIT